MNSACHQQRVVDSKTKGDIMSVVIIKVGGQQVHTHAKKDGSGSFTKTEVPVTLQRLADSDLPAGIQYTLWLNATTQAKVIALAMAFIAGTVKVKGSNEFYHRDTRLGFNNDAESFEFGGVSAYNGQNKSTGEPYTLQQETIWLKDDCVFSFEMLELPVDTRNGNINDILAECDLDLVGDALLSAPIPTALATAEEPF